MQYLKHFWNTISTKTARDLLTWEEKKDVRIYSPLHKFRTFTLFWPWHCLAYVKKLTFYNKSSLKCSVTSFLSFGVPPKDISLVKRLCVVFCSYVCSSHVRHELWPTPLCRMMMIALKYNRHVIIQKQIYYTTWQCINRTEHMVYWIFRFRHSLSSIYTF